MNEFQRIASDYFSAFEGRHHYPRFLSIYWFGWSVLLILWLGSMVKLFDPEWMQRDKAVWVTLALEALFFLMYVAISEYKQRSLYASLGLSRKASTADLDALRRTHLCEAFCQSTQEFARLAREGRELMVISDQLRPRSDLGLEGFWRGVHDPDRKARLMGIIFGALAILVSLLVVSLPPDSPSLIEIMSMEGSGRALILLMGLTVLGFGLWLVIRMTWFNLLDIARPWCARLGGKSSFVRVKLNYLVRDLVRLHLPVGVNEAQRLTPRLSVLQGKARQQRGIWKRARLAKLTK